MVHGHGTPKTWLADYKVKGVGGWLALLRRNRDLTKGPGLKDFLHDLETARKHYSAMRDLIIRHRGGSQNEQTLGRLRDLSRKAAAAIDDRNGKSLLSAVDSYGTDLFSESEHLKWAQTPVSGADFLRLRILRELDAFHARLLQLQFAAIRNEAARLAANLHPDRR